MKKLTALVLALVMVLSMASFAAAEEKPTLTMWIKEDLRIEDYETNLMTLWLQDQLGCELDFVVQPGTDYNTKVNMALTVGAIEDLPDIILGGNTFSDANVWEWAQAETIIPLNDYLANPELAKNVEEAKVRTGVDYISQITSPDGNVYSLPNYNQSYGNEYGQKLWIYKPWLDKLGMEVPTTLEELYNVLKAVVTTDLNENGKADEVGLLGTTLSDSTYGGWFEYLMNAFVYAGDGYYREVLDGKVSAAYTTPEWKEGLIYIKKMIDEGLVLAENLTMGNDQFKTLMNTEVNTVFAHVYAAPDMINKDLGRDVEHLGVAPMVGPAGKQYATFAPSVANPAFLITANCENPELAFKLGDLLQSAHIGITQRWGYEGLDWDYPENVEGVNEKYKPNVPGFEISLVAYSDGTFWGGTDTANSSWRQKGGLVRQYAIANGMALSLEKKDVYTEIWNDCCIMYQNGGWNPAQVIPKLIFTSDESDEVTEIQSNLLTYVQENVAAFLTGAKDIDADWDAYVAELDKIGLAKYLEVVQTVYDRMY